MPNFTISKKVNAPIDQVWASWDDFANIATFNPNLSKSFLFGPQPGGTGVGTSRECKMADGKNWVRERITGYVPGRSIALEIIESSMPIKEMKITTAYRKVSDNVTEITLTCHFQLKMGV
ncbi:MAG: SRPBCC family protein, partial [Pseudomonadota bacterium]